MLDKPTEGRVFLMAPIPQRLKTIKLLVFAGKLGFVFQDFNLLDTLSVKDNILLPLVLSRRPISGNDEKVSGNLQ